jgi:hypothetical protein
VIRSPTNGFVLAGNASSQFRIPGVPLVSKTVLDTSDPPMLRVIDTEVYEIVAGARRYRAAKLAALEQIPVRAFINTPLLGIDFAVITTDPNEVVEQLHDRMPCIIAEKDYDRWLQAGDPDRPPIDLLRPFDADETTAWRVDKAVGNVKNDSPELIEPASSTPNRMDEGTDGSPGPLFS